MTSLWMALLFANTAFTPVAPVPLGGGSLEFPAAQLAPPAPTRIAPAQTASVAVIFFR